MGLGFIPALENESKGGRRGRAFCNGERVPSSSDHCTSAIHSRTWKTSQRTEMISEPLSNSQILFFYEAIIRNKFGKYKKKRLPIPLSFPCIKRKKKILLTLWQFRVFQLLQRSALHFITTLPITLIDIQFPFLFAFFFFPFCKSK